MTGIENKLICLNLNASWQPVGFKTVKDAIVDLCGCDTHGKPATLALDIDYNIDDNGDPILTSNGNYLIDVGAIYQFVLGI